MMLFLLTIYDNYLIGLKNIDSNLVEYFKRIKRNNDGLFVFI